MRFLAIAAMAVICVVACSPVGAAKQRIVEKCMEGEQGVYSQQQMRGMCTCMADRLAEGLSPAQLEIVAKGADATAEEQATLNGDPEAMQVLTAALMTCASSLGDSP